MGNRRVLVLLSTAGGGDRQPVVALAESLAARGNAVSVATDAATARWFESTPIPVQVHPVSQAGYISAWATSPDPDADDPFLAWGRDAFPHVIHAVREAAPDIIVSTLFTMGLAELVASDLGVPWVFVNPSFYFGDDGPYPIEADWHGAVVARLVRECFLPLAGRADLVLHATDPAFDSGPAELPDGHHYVGFLHTEPGDELPASLARPGDPFALVTGSTARPKDEIRMLQAAVDALAGRSVRTVVTLPRPYPELDLPRNATTTGFVPHGPVLGSSAISINQAGHGIVSKCLSRGVPMVLTPWDADQPGVAARAKVRGVAEVIARSEVTTATVAEAVTKVLERPSYREAASRMAAQLARRDPLQTAAKLVERF